MVRLSVFVTQSNLSTARKLGNVGCSSRHWQSSISQLDKVLLHMACNLGKGNEAGMQAQFYGNFFTGYSSTCCVVLVPRALAIFSNLRLSIASGG